MLRQTREELRRTGEILPAVPEMPAAHREAASAEESRGNEAEPVVTATVAAGSPGERLLRYLNDAWSVETTLLDTLNKMEQEVIDPQVKEFFAAHRETTAQQRDALGTRLRELGREPSGGKGFFHRLVGGIWEGLHRPGDDIDRTVQDLMKGYATEHFEVAMYQALAACASAAGDSVTTELARRHQQEEREAAERVWGFLARTVALAASPPARAVPRGVAHRLGEPGASATGGRCGSVSDPPAHAGAADGRESHFFSGVAWAARVEKEEVSTVLIAFDSLSAGSSHESFWTVRHQRVVVCHPDVRHVHQRRDARHLAAAAERQRQHAPQ